MKLNKDQILFLRYLKENNIYKEFTYEIMFETEKIIHADAVELSNNIFDFFEKNKYTPMYFCRAFTWATAKKNKSYFWDTHSEEFNRLYNRYYFDLSHAKNL